MLKTITNFNKILLKDFIIFETILMSQETIRYHYFKH